MPSRTYIQMLLKLYNNGKLFLAKESLQKLNKYNAVLENHPEAMEEIVRRRADMLKYAKNICPNIDIMSIHMVSFEAIILDYMFMAELIELPKFDDFDTSPNLSPNFNRISAGFEPVTFDGVIVSVN